MAGNLRNLILGTVLTNPRWTRRLSDTHYHSVNRTDCSPMECVS